MFIIYKITNTVNGMMYIGKTKQSLQARWRQHCYQSNTKYMCFKLQTAIKEYGADRFRIEQIDSAETNQEANEKEVYWIQHFKAIENGYNFSRGGNDGGNRKKVMAVETGEVFESMVEAGKRYGLSHSMIQSVANKAHLRAAGLHWVTVDNRNKGFAREKI